MDDLTHVWQWAFLVLLDPTGRMGNGVGSILCVCVCVCVCECECECEYILKEERTLKQVPFLACTYNRVMSRVAECPGTDAECPVQIRVCAHLSYEPKPTQIS